MEASFERRAPSTVAPSVFEPEPELLGPVVRVPSAGDEKATAPRVDVNPPPAPSRSVATADLEVEVLRLLNQAGADMGEQINVTRTADGQLRIQGVVERDQRKSEILRAVAPVSSNPSVQVDVKTVAEATKQQRQVGSSSGQMNVQGVEVTHDTIAAEPELHQYFSARGERADEEIHRFTRRALTLSDRLMHHAWALKGLSQRFSLEDLRTLNPEARAKWLALIRSHAQGLQQETRALRQELEPIFQIGSAADGFPPDSEITDDASLIRAAERLFQLCSINDEVIRSAFSVSSGNSQASAIRTPQFWRALKSAESLAAKIQHATAGNK